MGGVVFEVDCVLGRLVVVVCIGVLVGFGVYCVVVVSVVLVMKVSRVVSSRCMWVIFCLECDGVEVVICWMCWGDGY